VWLFPKQITGNLVLSASLSGLVYLLIFTAPFPLLNFYQTIPPLDYTKLTGYSVSGFFSYVFGLGTLFALYLWAIRLAAPRHVEESRSSAVDQFGSKVGRQTGAPYFILLTTLILVGILVFSYPVTAIDLFVYAIRTRGWALYGLNPLTTAPRALPAADPWPGLAAEWVDAPSPYGPVWELLSLGAFHVSGGDFLSHLLALKIIGTAAYLGCTWLVYQILHQTQPAWARAGTIAFAWNPLVLLESVQNAHNDIVMTFFLMAAIWVLTARTSEYLVDQESMHQAKRLIRHSLIRYSLLCLFLALSISVKYITALTVPLFLVAMAAHQKSWPVRLVQMGGYSLAIAALVALLLWPWWPGWDNWAVAQAGGQAGRSLLALLVLAFKDVWGVNFVFDLFRNLINLIFGSIYLYYLWQCLFNSQQSAVSSQNLSPLPLCSPTLLLHASFHVLFWYVLLVVPVFHAWYLLWFLPLAVLLLPNLRPLGTALVFSMTALFIIPYFETIRVWYPVLLQYQLLGHLVGVPLLIVPPILVQLGWLEILGKVKPLTSTE
jgi:hypothetical protein